MNRLKVVPVFRYISGRNPIVYWPSWGGVEDMFHLIIFILRPQRHLLKIYWKQWPLHLPPPPPNHLQFHLIILILRPQEHLLKIMTPPPPHLIILSFGGFDWQVKNDQINHYESFTRVPPCFLEEPGLWFFNLRGWEMAQSPKVAISLYLLNLKTPQKKSWSPYFRLLSFWFLDDKTIMS